MNGTYILAFIPWPKSWKKDFKYIHIVQEGGESLQFNVFKRELVIHGATWGKVGWIPAHFILLTFLPKGKDYDKSSQLRQGDVLLIKVEDREDLTNEVSPVLAEGEVSGHKHEIVGGSVVTNSWHTEP